MRTALPCLLVLLVAASAWSATLNVGPGETYTTITAIYQRGNTYVYDGTGWQTPADFYGFCHTLTHNGTTWDVAYSKVQQ